MLREWFLVVLGYKRGVQKDIQLSGMTLSISMDNGVISQGKNARKVSGLIEGTSSRMRMMSLRCLQNIPVQIQLQYKLLTFIIMSFIHSTNIYCIPTVCLRLSSTCYQHSLSNLPNPPTRWLLDDLQPLLLKPIWNPCIVHH